MATLGAEPRNTMPTSVLFAWGEVARLGGSERRMVELGQVLLGRGIAVRSIARTNARETQLAREFQSAGINVEFVDSWRDYCRTLNNAPNSVVVTFGSKQAAMASILRRCFRWQGLHVNARNGLDFGWSKVHHLVDHMISVGVDIYLTNSYAVASHLKAHGRSIQKIRIVPGALSSDWLTTDVKEWPRTGPVRVLMVGNSRPEKNQNAGLSALMAVMTNASITVYTDNSAKLERQLKTTGTAKDRHRVAFVEDHVMEPRDYDNYDVLLHPSLSESLPRAVLEALARGCFVIAGDVGDTARLLPPARSIVLREEWTDDDLQNALRKVESQLDEIRRTRRQPLMQTTDDYCSEFVRVVNEAR